MGELSKIQWTHHTFNPWIGCSKVHTGCKNCYAESLATTRLGVAWGPDAARRVTAQSNWQLPRRWAKRAAAAGERHRVFCASLADVLDEKAPEGAQRLLWDQIRDTAHSLDWLLLTKRPHRWELVPADVRPLVWLGTSISDPASARQMLPSLLAAEGFRLLFASAEPLVEAVDLAAVEIVKAEPPHGPAVTLNALTGIVAGPDDKLQRLRWVIVGGESGSKARPFIVDWARSIVRQCKAAQVPVFVKQLGSNVGEFTYDGMNSDDLELRDSKGGDMDEWPGELRVREFPL